MHPDFILTLAAALFIALCWWLLLKGPKPPRPAH